MDSQVLKSFSAEVTKSSGIGHLLLAPLGHVGVNAVGRAAHHSSNLADVLAHRGFQHGLLELNTNPAAMRTVKSLAGAESVLPYTAAYEMGRKLRGLTPAQRQMVLKAGYGVSFDTKAPVISSLRKAVGHELSGTEPALEATGLGANLYGRFVDKMTGITNTPFDTNLQRVVKTVAGGAPLGALAAVDPYGTAGHVGVNAVREAVGNSKAGKEFALKTFTKGLLDGQEIPRVQQLAADYLGSPAVLDAYRIGRSVRQEVPAVVGQKLRGLLPSRGPGVAAPPAAEPTSLAQKVRGFLASRRAQPAEGV